MMVEHNCIDAMLLEVRDLARGTGAAIHRDEQLRFMLFEAARDSVRTETVTFLRALRQEIRDRSPRRLQDALQQRAGSHPVHNVVSLNDFAPSARNRGEHALD